MRNSTRQALEQKVTQLGAERDFASEYLLMKVPMIDEFITTVGPRLQALGIVV